jgi:hypothetical protein
MTLRPATKTESMAGMGVFDLKFAVALVLNVTILGVGTYLKSTSERWRATGRILQILCLLGLGMFLVCTTLAFLLSHL